MKRWRRRMFHLLAGASALLWLGGVLIWVLIPYSPPSSVTGFRWQPLGIYRASGTWSVDNSGYGLRVWKTLNPKAALPPSWQGIWHFGGFWFERLDPGPGRPMVLAVVPAWFCLIITAILPAGWIWLRLGPWKRQQRLMAGLCPGCGYDLRATPDQCPECGAVSAEAARESPAHSNLPNPPVAD